ncbi:hypothetical protein D3Z36_11595 [Lachnospiraceae bacterium]|nr:hypothetical protein [Lachnospiraceae bacterium]
MPVSIKNQAFIPTLLAVKLGNIHIRMRGIIWRKYRYTAQQSAQTNIPRLGGGACPLYSCLFLEKSIQNLEKNVANRKKYVTIIVCPINEVHTNCKLVRIQS